VLTGGGGGGGLGGCRWVVAKAAAAGEVKLTYSDWPISNWEKNRIQPVRPQHCQQSYTLIKDSTSSIQGSSSKREDGDYNTQEYDDEQPNSALL